MSIPKQFTVKVRRHKQKTDYTCGPASIKIALSHWDMNITEEALAKLCDTDENGTPVGNIEQTLISLGFKPLLRTRPSFKSFRGALRAIVKYLRRDCPIILCIEYPSWKGETHYAVLYHLDFDKKIVRLKDPMYRWGKDRILSFDKLKQVWFDMETVNAWLLAVKKK